jgi:glycosyltransferase involved in cell wall biosynthesis
MHILQVTLGFYPAISWGGPVKIVHRNGRELVRRGHRVTVYCTNLLDKKQKISPGTSEGRTFERGVDGMRVVYFNTWNLPWWPGTLGPVWLPDLPVYLRSEIGNYDIVHLNGYRNLMNVPVARVAQQAQVPLVLQPHGTMPIVVNSFLMKRLYDHVLGGSELRALNALIALQESERQQALARGVAPERIQIIPNGLDLSDLAEFPESGSFRRRFGIPADKPLILFLGRINKKKGADMLVEAFHRLGGLDAYLAIVGPDDGHLEEVWRLVVRYRLQDKVVLTGLLAGAEAMAACRDADLFVLPCRVDTLPTTIMEACLAGTPMVVTDRCEIAHLIKDRVADVVPFDAGIFAEAMRGLLTDRERYETYQANCPRVMADSFSLQTVVDRLEGLYQQIVAKSNNGDG